LQPRLRKAAETVPDKPCRNHEVRGMTEESIYAALLAETTQGGNPPLDEAEVKKIAHSVSRYQPNHPVKKYYHRTDSGNAERLRDRFGSIIRYCPAFKYWLYMTAVAGGKKPENLRSLLLEQQEICSQKQVG